MQGAALVLLSSVAQTVVSRPALAQEERFLPPAVVSAQLDSLERIALTDASQDRRVKAITRMASAGWITTEARRGAVPIEVRYPGVVERLARTYDKNDEYGIRYYVISLMMTQAEQAQAAAFLERVAQTPVEPGPAPPPGVMVVTDTPSLPTLAIGALLHVGPEGEAALRRLHAAGTVQEPGARRELENLAKRGLLPPGRP